MNLATKVRNNIWKKNIPYWLTWEITRRCNHRCFFCYNTVEKRPELKFAQICETIDKAKDLGVVNILFTGGEPFLRDDFLDILSYARKGGFTVSIISNGSLITKETADKLRNLYLISVAITVHSLKGEVFDRITGIKGSYSKTMSAIRFLRQNEVPVKIKCNIIKENHTEMDKLWSFAQKLGYLFHYGSSLMPQENGYCDFKSSCLTQQQREDMLKFVKTRTGSTGYYEKQPDKLVCNILKNSMTINAYGDVVPCFNLKTQDTNVLERDLRDIWYNPSELERWKNIKWKDMRSDAKKCAECECRNYCFICLADNYLLTKDVYKVDRETCQAAETAYRTFEHVRQQAKNTASCRGGINKEGVYEEAAVGKT